MDVQAQNPHWRDGFAYARPVRRDIFGDLLEALGRKRMLVLTGTRRTGKTTLMRQLIDELVSSGVPRRNVLYFSFDDQRPPVRELMGEYGRRLGAEMGFSGETYYVFLDEVQNLEDWQKGVKAYYDGVADVRFVLTGSASLFVKARTRESLAGRVREFDVGPLTFREYLRFAGVEGLANDPGLHREALADHFSRYLVRQYVETVGEDEDEIAGYARSIAEKVTHVDIPSLFGVEEPRLLMAILELVAARPGMLVNYASLAATLSGDSPVSRIRVSRYMDHLREAFMLKLVYNHRGSPMASERKSKKAYLCNGSLSMLSRSRPEEGPLAEQALVLALGAGQFWRTPQKQEVDIVLERNGPPVPVEVKYTDNVRRRDISGVVRFMELYGSPWGVIVTRDTEERIVVEGAERFIDLVPAWKVALFGTGSH